MHLAHVEAHVPDHDGLRRLRHHQGPDPVTLTLVPPPPVCAHQHPTRPAWVCSLPPHTNPAQLHVYRRTT